MNISFENKQMIVEHETGRIDLYTAADLQKEIAIQQQELDRQNDSILQLKIMLANVENS